MLRTHHHHEFDAQRLADRRSGQTVSVCLPARNEADTVGAIVRTIRQRLMEDVALVDEVLVVDDHSTDRTAAIAAAEGARVIDAATVLPEYGEGHGKGEALWKSLYASTGDVVVWCDADVRGFGPHFVTGLLGPLLTTDAAFVKGFYDRSGDGPVGGGRVTELVARPLLTLLFPALAPIAQPLGGEYAGRREVLEQVPFVQGYGVEMGLLVDLATRFGVQAIAQVDLGERRHRNRPLDELAPQALAVLHTALRRAGVTEVGDVSTLHRHGQPAAEVTVAERPPLVEVPSYRHLRSA
jgi:glucosyl-3-phosphoglycerate synthase